MNEDTQENQQTSAVPLKRLVMCGFSLSWRNYSDAHVLVLESQRFVGGRKSIFSIPKIKRLIVNPKTNKSCMKYIWKKMPSEYRWY